MTTDNETFSETLSDEELAAQIDGEEGSEKPESVEDSIINAINELEENETETDENIQGDKGKEPEIDASKAASILAKSKGKKREVIEAKDLQQPGANQEDEDITAPQAWDQDAKAEFSKLPPIAKKQTAAFWKRLDSHFQNGSQEIARQKQKYSRLEQVVEHYLPTLHDDGITDPAAAVAAALSLHREVRQNKHEGLLKWIGKNNTSLEELYRYRESRNGGQAPQQYQQQFSQPEAQPYLTRELIAPIIRQELEQHQSQYAQTADANELQQLRNQVGQDGRALYPELWDNQNLQSNYWNVGYLQRVQPLVEYERNSHPGISVAEATKRAIQLLRFRDGHQPGTTTASMPRLPNDQETIAKARAANVSIRGRGNGSIPITTAAQPGESVEQSLHRAIAELSNGRH